MRTIEFMESVGKQGENRCFYLDGKRVSRNEYRFTETRCNRFSCLYTLDKKGRRWAHYKTGYILD